MKVNKSSFMTIKTIFESIEELKKNFRATSDR